MTQKPKKSDFGEQKKKKKIHGVPRSPLEAYAFDARFGKRSVFILDPRLSSISLLKTENMEIRPSARQTVVSRTLKTNNI